MTDPSVDPQPVSTEAVAPSRGLVLSCHRCHFGVLMPLKPDGKHLDITVATDWEISEKGALCPRCAAAISPTPSPVEERLRKALERIAHHDGDRWDWDALEPGVVLKRVFLKRQPSPQEIAREALSPTEGETEQ